MTAGHEDIHDREVHRDSANKRTIQLDRKSRHTPQRPESAITQLEAPAVP